MRAVLLLLLIATMSPAAAAADPKFVMLDPPKAVPDVRFVDGDGRNRALSDFKGRVVLLNIWATWCVPCRKEMPTLDRLQSVLGREGVEVVARSIDRGGVDVVRKFYGEIGISRLAIYVDTSGRAFRDLAVVGLPTTILIDRAGREIGRVVGPAKWDAPETIDTLRRLIGRQTGALATWPLKEVR
jgi:thiol-disulfide isomerase/thioredoxin